MRIVVACGIVLGAVALLQPAAAAPFAEKKVLTLEIARKIVTAAESEATRNHLAGVVAVVDDGGWPILIERMDHAAYLASVELAPGKARTAALFKKPSQALEDAINHGRIAAVTAQGFTEMQPSARASIRRSMTCKSRKPGSRRSLVKLNQAA
jgi:glc operon protein GlcG